MEGDSGNGVGLFLSNSFAQKTYVGLFKEGSVLSFEGCTQVRLLAGILEVEGHRYLPISTYSPLYSPLTNSRMVVMCPAHGVPAIAYPMKEGDIFELNGEDIKLINCVLSGKDKFTTIALFKELKNSLVKSLKHHFLSANKVIPQKDCSCLNNFQILEKLNNSFIIPNTYRTLTEELVSSATDTMKILVCGKKNTGKSTLCKILLNNMLKRYGRVMYLECDVGQSEFTVPGVVSLHCITEPVHGPSYTHLGQQPIRAYFYGDNSPKHHPDLYLHLIKECVAYCNDNFKDAPLITNTCGYTSGLGIPIFHDIIRILSPTHIIQLRTTDSSDVEDLPLLTPKYLQSANGWDINLNHSISEVKGLFSSSKNECELDNKRVESEESPKTTNKRKLDHSEDTCNSSVTSKKFKSSGDTEVGVTPGERVWLSGQVCAVNVSVNRSISSKLSRLFSYIAYFSPLISDIHRSSSTSRISDMKRNFMMAARPYKVSWRTVAIHCIHEDVPRSELLRAINGKFVALGRVCDEEIVVDDNVSLRYLKNFHSVVDFLGLGLVRYIDMTEQSFYITTPESLSVLSQVNCIVLGKTESPYDLVSVGHIHSQEQPYLCNTERA